MVTTLPVMEQFLTLQGEGFWAGHVAYFIRLGGCDVGCPWCDVKESWPIDAHPRQTIDELVQAAAQSGAKRVVVTGGEPLMHRCTELVHELHRVGLYAHTETSGTHPLTGTWHWVTLSPKKFKPTLPEYYPVASELKVVVNHPSDLPWAEEHAQRCPPGIPLYLQPQWYRPESTQWVVEYALQHPHWRISVQTHKYLNIP
jgi:organic radical activating enzyme